MSDPGVPRDARLLHRSSAHGYTSHPGKAMRHEGEAVPADYQEPLADRARHDEAQRLAHEWDKCSQRVLGAVAHFEAITHPSDRLRSNLRVVTRAVERVGRELQ